MGRRTIPARPAPAEGPATAGHGEMLASLNGRRLRDWAVTPVHDPTRCDLRGPEKRSEDLRPSNEKVHDPLAPPLVGGDQAAVEADFDMADPEALILTACILIRVRRSKRAAEGRSCPIPGAASVLAVGDEVDEGRRIGQIEAARRRFRCAVPRGERLGAAPREQRDDVVHRGAPSRRRNEPFERKHRGLPLAGRGGRCPRFPSRPEKPAREGHDPTGGHRDSQRNPIQAPRRYGD